MGEGENSTARWLTVNGQRREVVAADDTPLLYVLRNHLDLKGTRFGCGLGLCGLSHTYTRPPYPGFCTYPVPTT